MIVAPNALTNDPGKESKETDRLSGKVRTVGFEAPAVSPAADPLDFVEQKYRIAYEQAESPSDDAVEAFLDAAIAAWLALNQSPGLAEENSSRLNEIYHSSLVKFIQYVEEYGRRDPKRGILVNTSSESKWLPVNMTGFSWKPSDIHDLVLVDPTSEDLMGRHQLRDGFGVPLIGLHHQKRDQNLPAHSAFPVTCVLHVTSNNGATDVSRDDAVIELIEPRSNRNWTGPSERSWPLAADFTAHWEWYAQNSTTDALYGFRHPDASGNDSRLIMLEPYQRGKIPVVFVHGLLSDPTTWIELANAFEGREPCFYERYQLLAFQYPTGKSFLDSANDLRQELKQLFDRLWSETADPALLHTILVGHSMGGLLSRFQVTQSSDQLWKVFSDDEFDDVRMETTMRRQIGQMFFFEPSRYVKRVVFVATPHNGSRFAEISIGKLAALLVERKTQKNYQRLLAKNPGKLIDHYDGRMPTSTDLLVPNNPVLQALATLEFSPDVHLHSIVGTGQFMLGTLESDGVVPVQSAKIPGVESELMVHAKHSGIQRHPDTVSELHRIFNLHWRAVSQSASLTPESSSTTLLQRE